MMLDVMKGGFTEALLFPGGKGTERLLDAFVDAIMAVDAIMEKLKPCFHNRMKFMLVVLDWVWDSIKVSMLVLLDCI